MALFELIGFDMSGTLSDDRHLAYETICRLYTRLEIPVVQRLEDWTTHAASCPTSEFELLRAMGRYPALKNMTAQDYVRAFSDCYNETLTSSSSANSTCPTPIPGAIEGLLRLATHGNRGPPPGLFLVSACPQLPLEEDLERYGIRNLFTYGIVGGCTDKAAAIRQIAESSDVEDMSHVAYVGDTTGDVAAAKAAKVFSVAVTCGYHTRDALEAANPESLCQDVYEFSHARFYRTAKPLTRISSFFSPPLCISRSDPGRATEYKSIQ